MTEDITLTIYLTIKDSKKLEKVKKKVYLTKDEVKLIENVELIPRLDRVRDCFLLMCYLGLRISDLKSVNKSNIDGENQRHIYRCIRMPSFYINHSTSSLYN